MGESGTMWRVFWVPLDAARTGVPPQVLPGWKDLSAREKEVGVRPGDPVLMSPDHRVDALLSLYFQSAKFRRYRAETRRNYAQDIALLLTFLWSRDRSWTDAVDRDLEDYEGGPMSGCAATAATEFQRRDGQAGWRTGTSLLPGCWSARACAGPRAGPC